MLFFSTFLSCFYSERFLLKLKNSVLSNKYILQQTIFPQVYFLH